MKLDATWLRDAAYRVAATIAQAAAGIALATQVWGDEVSTIAQAAIAGVAAIVTTTVAGLINGTGGIVPPGRAATHVVTPGSPGRG